MENICRFIPLYPAADTIHIIHFVQETKTELLKAPASGASYRLFLVTAGRGTLQTDGRETVLSEGDIFFVFPGMEFSVQNTENFVCIYISFLGMRANMILQRLEITAENLHFSGFSELAPFWKSALGKGTAAPDLISESVLLYTFAALADRIRADKAPTAPAGTAEVILRIKAYVDENFADPALSLDSVARLFSYNKKYLSAAFKREMKTGFCSYLNIVRCRHACRLMEQNFTCIQDIAFLCGFSDPMYFSRVFKQKMGTSPRQYREGLKNK